MKLISDVDAGGRGAAGRGRSNLSLCLLLLLLAFVPRAGHAVLHGDEPLGGDEPEYDALARGLVQTGSYASQPGFSLAYYSPADYAPTAYRAPGFPATLAAVYAAFGHRPFLARVILAAVGASGAVLLFLLALELFQERRYALLAGVAWALWPASIYHTGTASSTLGPEALAVPLLLAPLLLLARSLRRPSLLEVAGAGVILGLATLVRSNLLFAAGFAAVWVALAWWRPRGWRRACLAACVLGAACLLVVLPWVVRNRLSLGVATIATQSDVLFLGNNDWARGSFNSEGGKLYLVIAPYSNGTLPALASRAGGGDLRRAASELDSEQFRYLDSRHPGFLLRSEAEKYGIYRREAFEYAAAHPARMAWLVYRKVALLWLPLHESGPRYDYSFMYGFILPFVVVGAACAVVRRSRRLLLMLIPILSCLVTAVVVFGLPRYRYLAEPALVILAVAGARRLARRYPPSAVALAALAWLAVNLGAAFVLAGNRFGL